MMRFSRCREDGGKECPLDVFWERRAATGAPSQPRCWRLQAILSRGLGPAYFALASRQYQTLVEVKRDVAELDRKLDEGRR